MDRALLIKNICDLLLDEKRQDSINFANENYPFINSLPQKRQYSKFQMCKVFLRDGFIDRYTGDKLLFPGLIKILTIEFPNIFGLMRPMENAIESYIELAKHYDVYILSTSPWENETALIDKLRWVKKYLGEVAYKRLILSHYKNLNKGDYLIDDRINNGAGEFEGEHIHFGTEKFRNWDDVTKYLIN